MTNNADNNSKPLLRQYAILLNESLLIIQIPFCSDSFIFASILFILFAACISKGLPRCKMMVYYVDLVVLRHW